MGEAILNGQILEYLIVGSINKPLLSVITKANSAQF